MDWDTIIFGGITSRQLVVVCIIVMAAMFFIKRRRKKEYKNQMKSLHNTIFVLCNNCDWQGNMSKFGTHCPKCNLPVEHAETPKKPGYPSPY
jgi:hypothetical protein